METKEIIQNILKAIYWREFNKKQLAFVTEMVESNNDPMSKANEICEFLEIEKRGNRAEIMRVLK